MNNELIKNPISAMTTFLTSDAVKGKVNQIIGDKNDGARLISTLVSAVQQNPGLANCERGSLINCALLAHTLKLEPSSQLGYFHLVPFNKSVKNRDGSWDKISVATAVIGYKGYIQLALRTGQYKSINAIEVKSKELKHFNRLTDEIDIVFEEDDAKREKLATIGYASVIELNNGFKKVLYWSKEKMEQHAIKYSTAYSNDLKYNKQESFWSKNFDEQAKKTMLRQIISKYGIISTEMQEALKKDTALIKDTGEVEYVDNVKPEYEETEQIADTNPNDRVINEKEQDELLKTIVDANLKVAPFFTDRNIEDVNTITLSQFKELLNEIKNKD